MNFVPRDAVRWFSPTVLAMSGMRVVLAGALGSYMDKRELQQSFPSGCIIRHGQEEELWFDFIADTGDGFDATYSVAWLAGRERLRVTGSDRELPRAQLLVLGGDQVYPCAAPSAYEDRFAGPFRAAFPLIDDENAAPSLVAIPGNHDWYDGLTAFVRLFTQERWIGAWRSVQRRSYAAVQLPHNWWLWAIDLQKGAELDEPQRHYFEGIARELMGPDAKVILCVPEPAWVDAAGDPSAYAALDFLERKLIEPVGARVLLMLSGDSHHYAHYVGDDGSHKVTAGGGGAFLHPTHDLPGTITLESPTPGGTAPPATSSVTYRLEDRCYPTRRTSRRLAWGAVLLPIRNPSFLMLSAPLHLAFLTTNKVGLTDLAGRSAADLEERASTLGFLDLASGLFRSPASILLIVAVTALLVAFAKPSAPSSKNRRARVLMKVVMGAAHGASQVAAVIGVEMFGVKVAGSVASGYGFTASLVVIAAGVGALVGAFVMGAYLASASALFGLHGNEAFSSLRLTRHKCFLRLHIGNDGRLTVHPLGVDQVWHRWRPGGHQPGVPASGQAMLVPDGPGSDGGPGVHLIEPPFVIG